MKRKRLFGAGVIVLAALIVSIILSCRHRELKFHYIEQIHFQDGYLYYTDRGEDDNFRIILSDPEGKQGDAVKYFRYGKGTYRTVRQLFFGGQGETYALIEETDAASGQPADCSVFRCDFEKGKLVKTEFDFTGYRRENQEIYIQGMRNGGIYYFVIPQTAEKRTELCFLDSKGEKRQIDSLLLEHPYLKSQFFFSENGMLLWMDYSGKLAVKKAGEDKGAEIAGITDQAGSFKSLSDDGVHTAFVIDYEADRIQAVDLEHMSADTAYTAEEIRKQKEDFSFRNLQNPDCTKTGFCAGIRKEKADDTALACWYHDGVYLETDRVALRLKTVVRSMAGVYGIIAVITFFVWLCWYIYCKYRMQTILVRLALVLIVGLFAVDYGLEWWIRQTVQGRLEKNQTLALSILGEQLKEHITEQIEEHVTEQIEEHVTEQIEDAGVLPLGSEDWLLHRGQTGKNGENTESEEMMQYIYSIIRAEEDGTLKTGESVSEYKGVPVEWSYSGQSLEAIYAAYESLESVVLFEENETGKWNNRFLPLVLGNGKVYGVLALSVNGNLLDYQIWQYQQNLKSVSLGLLLILSVILIFILFLFLRPLKNLKKGAGRLAAGELGITVPVRGHDEISGISAAFNQMSSGLANYVRDIQDMSDGYYRFIPAKILELLGKKSIQEVQLGDEITETMTILSVYAANHQKQEKNWSAKKVYQEINRLMEVLVAAVAGHHGVVEHFEDTGLSAFFTGNSREALDAAIEIHKALEKQEYGKGRTIAISYGQVMTGVIGYENRMEVATISVHSDLAKMLCRKGETYGAGILITHPAYQQIDDFEKHYHARYLGNVFVSGKDTLERIYDVYDGDSEEDFYYKELTKPLFEHGVELFVAKKFYEARLVFVKVLKQYRKDRASKEYLYRCDKYYKLADTDEAETVVEHF